MNCVCLFGVIVELNFLLVGLVEGAEEEGLGETCRDGGKDAEGSGKRGAGNRLAGG